MARPSGNRWLKCDVHRLSSVLSLVPHTASRSLIATKALQLTAIEMLSIGLLGSSDGRTWLPPEIDERIQDMTEHTENRVANLVDLTSDVVAAYVAKNSVPAAELPNLIKSVHAAMTGLATGSSLVPAEETYEMPTPAQIRKSVRPDGIVSFLDGKTYQTMKRHLTSHGLDAFSYRQRFGLPADYPMVSANYAAKRSELAKAIGLGQVVDRGEGEQSQLKRPRKAA